MMPGLLSPRLKRRITSTLFSAWRSFHRSSPSLFALDARTGSMILLRPISAKLSQFTTPATFSHGTVSSRTLTRRHCEMSVITRATSLTTTGRAGQTTQRNLPYSTALRPLWVAMAFLVAPTRLRTVFLPTLLL
jgi:hypothetical protein